MTFRVLLKGLVLLASLALLAWVWNAWGLHGMLDAAWIDRHVRGQGLEGELLFLGMAMLTTALGVPRQVVAFFGGYAFGLLLGSALALLGTLLGSVLAFYYARHFARDLVQRRFSARIGRLDAFLAGHPFSMALIIRLLPVGSNVATNVIAGVSSVAVLPFMAGTALGYVPQTLVFALAGSGINLEPGVRLTLAVVLFIATTLLGVWLYRRHRDAAALVSASAEAEKKGA